MSNKELKKNVQDLLNQLIILTKDVKEPQQVDDYNYQRQYVTTEIYNDRKSELEKGDELVDSDGEALKKPNDDDVYLFCVGQYAKRVVDGNPSDAAYNENQYHNSNC